MDFNHQKNIFVLLLYQIQMNKCSKLKYLKLITAFYLKIINFEFDYIDFYFYIVIKYLISLF
jgi:hypothetical protein